MIIGKECFTETLKWVADALATTWGINMKKLNKRSLESALAIVVKAGNPYKNQSIQFFIDRQPRFIFKDEVYTTESLDQIYEQTATKDIEKGYADRMVGYYDKWYRYNRADNGRAYDKGVELAMNQPSCKEYMVIIPNMGGV
jgi:hypothetical protein